MRYSYVYLTDKGRKEINQDAVYINTKILEDGVLVLGLIADGMGGIGNGEVASQIVKEEFKMWFEDSEDISDYTPDMLAYSWQKIIDSCCEKINALNMTNGIIPGTTLTMILLYNSTYYVANIGDSRVYYLSDELYQITVDHSWVQIALEQGMSAREIESDSRKNRITRCIGAGIEDVARADFFIGDYETSDYFMLCSDGLRHYISTKEFKQCLRRKDMTLQEKGKELIELAKQRGEEDNISCILIEVY